MEDPGPGGALRRPADKVGLIQASVVSTVYCFLEGTVSAVSDLPAIANKWEKERERVSEGVSASQGEEEEEGEGGLRAQGGSGGGSRSPSGRQIWLDQLQALDIRQNKIYHLFLS